LFGLFFLFGKDAYKKKLSVNGILFVYVLGQHISKIATSLGTLEINYGNAKGGSSGGLPLADRINLASTKTIW
jgi:hypothetical protein